MGNAKGIHSGGGARAIAALVVLGALGTAPRVQGQELEDPGPHQGYYLALGGHGDVVLARQKDGGWRDPWWGGHGDLRLGQAIYDRLDLGIAFGAGSGVEDGYRAVFGHVSLEVQLRPVEPLFFRLGIGMGFADVSRTAAGLDAVIGRYGADFTVAVGYDFFPGHKGQSGGFAITPVVGFRAGPGGQLGTYAVFVGLEISFWTGLSRDRLELPVEDAYRAE